MVRITQDKGRTYLMECDNCRQGTYTQVAIHSNVKSSVHVIVQCFRCGYQTIKKQNSKRRLESI